MPLRLMLSQSRSGSGRDNIMANTLHGVTVLALLAGCGAGANIPSPSFRFSYTQPDGETVSQYYSGPSDDLVYQYGYNIPGQARSEKKTYDGQVEGAFAYTDPNGELIQVAYDAAPGVGFRTVQQEAVARSGAVPSVVPAQATFDGITPESDITSDPDFAANYPQLLASVRSGELVPFKQAGQQAFRVIKPFGAESQRSFSELANRLDVDLFAPRHDQQVRSHPGSPRNYQSDGSNKGVLQFDELADGTPIVFITLPSLRI